MQLVLSFLGACDVMLDGTPARFPTAKSRALLAYLATEADRPHRRAMLAELLWPDHDEAATRQSLSQELTRLRRALQAESGALDCLDITTITIRFKAAAAKVDVIQFRELVATCAVHRHDAIAGCPACISRLQTAVSLYRGEFLGGFVLKDNQPFNEWCLYQRERLHRQALDALEVLIRHHLDAADFLQVQRYAEGQVALEPWHEEGHRHLMRALAALGERTAALAQYNRCRRILAEELGVEPSPETQALYDQIRNAGAVDELGNRSAHQQAPALPAPLTLFVGRMREMVDVIARLREPGMRLLTLVGIGGIGKTRLALEVARTHAAAYPDGVYFVPLTPEAEPASLAAAIANAIGLNLQGKNIWGELLRAIKSHRASLVIDGLEYVLALPDLRSVEEAQRSTGRTLTELLEAAPGVQVIATSRVRLGIPGEHVYAVGGLEYQAGPGVDDAATSPAVRLLVESTRRRNPHFTLNPANVAAALRICELVQGMPLGIELAAAWLEVLTPAEVAAEIERNIDFLADEHPADALGRHSLRGVFEWSWRLLNDRERQALRRLSVFHGGFTRDAAQIVADVSLRDLTGLVHKSLLRPDWARSAGGYEIHEVVRQFAAEYLQQDSREQEAVEARHGVYYLDLLEGFETRIDSPQAGAALVELQSEAAHIRQAWAWAAQRQEYDRIDRTTYSLWQFYFISGRWLEAERAFHEAVASMRAAVAGNANTAALVAGHLALFSKLLAIHGYTLLLCSRYEQATAAAAEAMTLAATCSGMEAMAVSAVLQGHLLARTGAAQAARPHFEQALALSRRHQSDYPGELLWDMQWSSEHGLAYVCLMLGELAAADSHLSSALQLCRSRGKRRGESYTLYHLGEKAYHTRDYPAARSYYEQFLHITLADDDRGAEALALLGFGETLRLLGEYGRAHELLTRAVAYQPGMGAVEETRAISCLSRLELYLGNMQRAHQWLAVLAGMLNQVQKPEVWAFARQTQALLALQGGEPEQALAHAAAAHQLLQTQPNPYYLAATLVVVGHAATAAGRPAEARDAYQQALRLYEMLAAPTLAAEAHAGLADIAAAGDDLPLALPHLEAALAILAEHPRAGLDEPFRTYLACYRVLVAACDPRAPAILTQGQALLMDYAGHIQDAALRQSFLENVAEHRELLQRGSSPYTDVQ